MYRTTTITDWNYSKLYTFNLIFFKICHQVVYEFCNNSLFNICRLIIYSIIFSYFFSICYTIIGTYLHFKFYIFLSFLCTFWIFLNLLQKARDLKNQSIVTCSYLFKTQSVLYNALIRHNILLDNIYHT